MDALLASLFEREPWVATASVVEAEVDGAGGEAQPAHVQRFERGRRCAMLALERAGGPRQATIHVGAGGEPLWPEGWVGSLSHSGRVAIAAVAPATCARALGIDLEPDVAESSAFVRRVCNDEELAAIDRLEGSRGALGCAVFSAKEALCKAQFPLSRETLGLSQVQVLLSRNEFVARFRQAVPTFPEGTTLTGRWANGGGWIVTAVCLP